MPRSEIFVVKQLFHFTGCLEIEAEHEHQLTHQEEEEVGLVFNLGMVCRLNQILLTLVSLFM